MVLGNQIYPEQIAKLKQTGYLEGGVWTKAYVKAKYPQVIVDGRIHSAALKSLAPDDRRHLGAVLFQYHCNDCHAADFGYSAVGPLLRGRTPRLIRELLDHLELAQVTMPPWSGTPEEADLLTEYLVSIAPKRPQGMSLGQPAAEARP